MPTTVVASIAASAMYTAAVDYAIGTLVLGELGTLAFAAAASGLTSMAVNAAFSDSSDASQGQQQFVQELRDNLVTVRQPISHWRYIYGRDRVPGALTFMHESADDKLHLVITFAGHVCEEIEAIKFNDEVVPLDVDGNATGRYAGYVRIKKSLGDEAGQPFPDLVAESEGKWTDAHRQSGRTKIYVRLTFNVDIFPTGLPNITAIIKGWKVYDPRTGLTAWSDNASLCQAHFLCDVPAGLGSIYVSEIDEPQLIAAANIDDEPVNLAGGGTEKRYTLNGSFAVNTEPRTPLGRMLTANAGKARYIGGVWRLHPAAYATPTITLNEGDVRAVPHITPRLSGADLANGVKGLYVSEDNYWQSTDFPPITNATYLAEDEGERSWRELDLPFTKSAATAQRIAKIELEQVRQQISVDWPGKFTCYRLQPGDTVKLDFTLLGWSEKVFEVEQAGLVFEEDDGIRIGCDLVLRETSSTVFDWNSGEETTVDPAPDTNLPDPYTVAPLTGLTLASGTAELFIAGDGTIVPRIKASWAASTDAFVASSGRIQVQFKRSADSVWQDAAQVAGDAVQTHVPAVDDGVNYDVRIRAENSLGVRSAWTTATGHTVIGKTEKPATVAGLSLNGKTLAWPAVADIDLAGYRVRFQYGVNLEWGTANPMHVGLLTESPYPLQIVPPGQVTIMVRAVDTTGNESEASAYVITDFGDTPVANVVESYDFKAATWPGSYIGATLSGGNLQADQPDAFYKADASDFYGSDGAPFFNTNYAAMEWTSSGWTPSLAAAGSNMILAWTLTGEAPTVQYRQTGPLPFYADDLSYFYGADADPFYDAPPDWSGWPGSLVAQNQEYQWRVSTSPGATSGLLSAFTVSVDVPDKTLLLNGVAIGSGGTRLAGAIGEFNVIQNIQLTLQGGSSAMKVEASDYNNPLGPLVDAKNSSGGGVAATIDAQLQGY